MRLHALQSHLQGEGHEPYEEGPAFRGGCGLFLVALIVVFIGWCIKRHFDDEKK